MRRFQRCLAQLFTVGAFTVLVGPLGASEPTQHEPNRDNYERVSAKSLSPLKNLAPSKNPARSEILEISEQIDSLVLRQLTAKGEELNKLAKDEVFLRRVYLDAIGRIPTVDETTDFLAPKHNNKRAELIDSLLDSYGYVSRQFNFYADLLRIKSRAGRVAGQPYIDFIKDSLAASKPYDTMVRELLTSEGPMMQSGNGAVGYYLRDGGMPEDNMSNTIRVFLGTRLECAQCHDHPFDKWTQRQYFEMVAFTGGMDFRLRQPDSEYADGLRALRRRRGKIDPQVAPALRRIIAPMTFGITGTGTGLARLPEGFMGSDGDEFDIVKCKTMFDELPLVEPEIPSSPLSKRVGKNPQAIRGARELNSREKYAEWLVAADNPRFAKVIANRLWKQAFGIGLIEPVDVIEDGTVASNPALMDFLTQTMIDLDFDTKQFLRAIYNSSTYQRMATKTDVVDRAEYNFNGPVVRRMSAEQIWDSLLTMTVEDVDQRQEGRVAGVRYLMGGEGSIYDRYEQLRQMRPDELLEVAANFRNGKGRKAMMSASMMADREEYQEKVNAVRRRIARETRRAKIVGDETKLQQLKLERSTLMAKFRRQRKGNSLYRASEIESPARPGHFLREFGQSDRESIDNSNSDPAVTQVLSLMNGLIEGQICNNPNTVLMRNILKADIGEKMDAVYLTMLNRYPTSSETKVWSKAYRTSENKTEVVPDLIWVLANSNEFIFVK